MVSKKERNHYDLIKIEITLEQRFQRDWLENSKLWMNCIHDDIHEGSGDTSHSKAMSAYLGRTPT